MPRFIFDYSLKYNGVFEVEAYTLQGADDRFNGTALSVLEAHVNKEEVEIVYELSDEPPEGEGENEAEDEVYIKQKEGYDT